jgi:transposase
VICAAIERCAGIDVGKKFLAVCALIGPLDGEPRAEKRRYGTTMAELERLRDWLVELGVTHVVMESTGSYWKPVFNVLEEVVRVYLANPQEVKNRKGHKTDDKDGWWLAHLLRHAMIHPSFIPPRVIRELRDLTRRRKRLLGDATSERNRVQKVLEDANVKLGNELSDVFGASGQLMLDALLEGKATPEQIAQLAQKRAKRKIPQIIVALQGHRMQEHHRRMIRYSLEHLQFLEEQIGRLDEDIRAKIVEAKLEPQWELVQSVPAVAEISGASILAETGGDMTPFPSVKNLSSWAGLCPGNNRSAGKSKSSHTNRGNPWLRSALVECSWAATMKQGCFIKEKFWRIVLENARTQEGTRADRGGAYAAAVDLPSPEHRPTVRGARTAAAGCAPERAHHPASCSAAGEIGDCHLFDPNGPSWQSRRSAAILNLQCCPNVAEERAAFCETNPVPKTNSARASIFGRTAMAVGPVAPSDENGG